MVVADDAGSACTPDQPTRCSPFRIKQLPECAGDARGKQLDELEGKSSPQGVLVMGLSREI
jgi:hypothetical protein